MMMTIGHYNTYINRAEKLPMECGNPDHFCLEVKY